MELEPSSPAPDDRPVKRTVAGGAGGERRGPMRRHIHRSFENVAGLAFRRGSTIAVCVTILALCQLVGSPERPSHLAMIPSATEPTGRAVAIVTLISKHVAVHVVSGMAVYALR